MSAVVMSQKLVKMGWGTIAGLKRVFFHTHCKKEESFDHIVMANTYFMISPADVSASP